MAESAAELVAELLTGTVTLLDIPPDLQAAAEATYDDVGLWMTDRLEGGGDWRVYPQGSMRLGTVVRPSENDEYDIDAVAVCDLRVDQVSQAELKGYVGDALESYVEAREDDDKAPSGCEEGGRCWTLTYDEQPFHMDVLPAIPNPKAPPTGILLSDRDLFRWQPSNPIAFAEWFRQQSVAEFLARREALAKNRQVDVDQVPSWDVKTTLQQVVQVIKLHRNFYFADDLDSRPPSVVVTTLAAKAYGGQKLLFDAVMDAAALMPKLVEMEDGRLVVRNPVHLEENFADRWGQHLDRATKFFLWLDDLQETLEDAKNTTAGMDKMIERLGARFGRESVQKAAKQLGETRTTARDAGGLAVTTAGAVSVGSGIKVAKHVFHGE